MTQFIGFSKPDGPWQRIAKNGRVGNAMGVEREEIIEPGFVGVAIPLRAVRGESGQWSVEFALDFTLTVDECRKVRVYRTLAVRANDQIGRKAKRFT